MKLFEGKTKSERNKTIAAICLGAASLIVLFFAFGRGMFGGGTTAKTAKPSPSPKKTTTAQSNPGKVEMPSLQQQHLGMMTPVRYRPEIFDARGPGRNIFAFQEPPKPCPECPTPAPRTPDPTPPPPIPTPPIQIAAINPQSVYAGSNGFRMEIAGDKFTPDTKIYFEQQEIPATFINETRMTADIPNVLIRNDGTRSIIAQSTDGALTSNQIQFQIQPPPKPAFQYIGMIARTRGNNDTAYFQEQGKPLPTGARLNDVMSGRFRVISISVQETILEDVTLGFKHKLPLHSPPPTAVTGQPVRPGMGQPGRGFPREREVYRPMDPNMPAPGATNTRIPGIPDNIPRYIPPNSNSNTRNPSPTKQQNDDEDDDGIDK